MRRQVSSMPRDILKLNMEQQLSEIAASFFGKAVGECTDEEIAAVLMEYSRRLLLVTEKCDGTKKVYYVSAEYLPGRLLLSNLINLKTFERVQEYLRELGRDLVTICDVETEPGLGSGGLGRLASCLLDACATQGYPVEGIGLCYHYGLFAQSFSGGEQVTGIRPWMGSCGWLKNRSVSYEVSFGSGKVQSRMIDIDVVGFDNGKIPLHLFDLKTADERMVNPDTSFDKSQTNKNLTLFVYPDDNDEQGRLLRIHQQYFLASNAVQLILQEQREKRTDLRDLSKYCVIQINDTHATLMVPELIRILIYEKAFDIESAIRVVEQVCAYTNHTTLAGAFGMVSLSDLEQVVPQLIPIILYLDRRVKVKYQDPDLFIIDSRNMVHMVRICMHFCFSINGVSKAHTEILETHATPAFYQAYPEKFRSITNGISFRRWLFVCNRGVGDLLTEKISAGYKKDPKRLQELLAFADDDDTLMRLAEVKRRNKERLAAELMKKQGTALDPSGVYDIMAKGFQGYKRQHLFVLGAIHTYLEIKRGRPPKRTVNFIAAGKAAKGYCFAQDILHTFLALKSLVESDAEASRYMRLAFVEDYGVSWAELLVPACDISEQIAVAGKEASGTTNMKYMLNGALTLCTLDGTNREIASLVGPGNIYPFGLSIEEVFRREENADGMLPCEEIAGSASLRSALAFLVDRRLLAHGSEQRLRRVHDLLLTDDRYFALTDFDAYVEARERMLADYEDRRLWQKKVVENIGRAGCFSADRTVEEYEAQIWKL